MTIADRFANLSPLKRALLALDEMKARLDAAEQARREPIAVIGLGCRMPGAPGPEQFWQLLKDGVSPLREIPPDRWDADAFYDADVEAPGKMTTRHGAFLDRVDLFDPQFFGIAPREAVSMDPQQRLLLEVSYEALEDAGIAPDSLSGTSTGVFVGIAASDYVDLVKAGDLTRIDSHFASGIAHSIASGRLAYILGLQGPAISIDTACSSGLVAVHLACQSLLAGDCQLALAGGVNVIATPDLGVVFSKSRMLSADGRCKTFDAAADGFGRGEGCGVVVLKRLSQAVADGDRIAAVIPGSGVNQDGPSSGLTAPNGPAQEAVIRAALARAGLQPADIDLIEAHGTGTSLGDPIEVQALGAVFGPRPDGGRLAVTSVKTNVGHLEAAAGVAGLLKVILALQHETIPPHLHLQRLNPLVDWDDLAIDIPTSARPWPRSPRARIAGVSSFGFSGTNVHVLVREAPPVEPPDAALERPQHLLTVSARSDDALRTRVVQLLAVLEASGGEPRDAAFTANVGRAQFGHRLAVRGSNLSDLRDGLRCFVEGATVPGVHTGRLDQADRPRVALLFTGQGAQYVGMGRQLYETQPAFRHVLDQCDAILRPQLDASLLDILYGDTRSALSIDDTAITQPALFAIDYALAMVWRSWGIEPAAVIGHSLGEYVAACVAGVFSLEDALTLVAARGRLMQALPRDGAMASVFADEPLVAEAIAPFAAQVSIAALNEPRHVVISGGTAAVDDILARLALREITSKRLTVSHAFHSPLMRGMLDDFTAIAGRVSFAAPRVPVVSNVTGAPATAAEIARPGYWRDHVLAPVRFAEGVAALQRLGASILVEAGPHPTLLGMAARGLGAEGAERLPSLRRGHDDWTTMLDSLARVYCRGVRVDWAGFDRGYARRKVSLPTYPFERERHWITDVKPAPRPAVRGDAARHPLLGHRVRVAGMADEVFEASIDASSCPWVFDHRVHGTVILPGTAFIELSLAAAAEIWPGGEQAVEDLALHSALRLSEDRPTTIQVVVSGRAGDGAAIRIFSADADASDRWTLHAEGRVRQGRGAIDAGEPLDLVEARCETSVDVAGLYGQLDSVGLALGPAFRGLRRVRRGEGEAISEIELPPIAGDAAAYGVHPVLLDNALQTLAAAVFGKGEPRESFLPVAVGHAYVAGAPGPAALGHAVVRPDPSGDRQMLSADVFLRRADGIVLAAVRGLRLRRADRATLQQAFADARDALYEVRWQPRARIAAATGGEVDPFPPLATIARAIEAGASEVAAVHGLPAYDRALPEIEALSAAYIEEALGSLGWRPSPGDRASERGLTRQLSITPAQQRLFGRLLEILEETGLLRRAGEDWIVERRPARHDTGRVMSELKARYGAALAAELDLLAACGPHLAGVLSGAIDPLSLLFPDGSAEMAEALYQTSPAGRAFNQLIGDAVGRLAASLPPDRRLRVLEIGGGTGATSSYVLPNLAADRVAYVFSDVSPAFTTRAARKFADYPFVSYRPLDIERDPAAQGFAGRQFDIVLAANVLHATRDLGETFGHVRQLLAPGGLLFMLEIHKRQRWVDLTFGMTDGWWRFVDRDRRPSYPLLERDEWLSFLATAGFTDVAAAPGGRPEGIFGIEAIVMARAPRAEAAGRFGRWLILGDPQAAGGALAERLEARGAECRVVDPSAGTGAGDADPAPAVSAFLAGGACRGLVHAGALDDPAASSSAGDVEACMRRTCGSALAVVKQVSSAAQPPSVTIVTRHAHAVTAADTVHARQAPLWGLAKVVAIEHPELDSRAVDVDETPASLDALVDELLDADGEREVAFRDGARHVARLARYEAPAAPLGGSPYRLESAERGSFDRLGIVPAPHRSPGPGEVEIAIAATALNFADVMDALGVRPGGASEFGGECAGRIVAVGDGVDGFAPGDDVVALADGCFGSHVTCPAALVWRRPPALSAEQAAALPIAFVTARYALHEIGRLERGERVLVHAGAGGVGLAAVQLARRAGAELFVTAGSAEKRAYLASLGITHVFNSRTTAFAEEIRQRTDGRGVDVVLNSLAGSFIPATLGAVAPGGRFLEIGKTGWSPEQVTAARPDVEYHVLDWWPIKHTDPARIRVLVERTLDDLAAGAIDPLPVTTFPVEESPSAFRFMAQARHIGKVVVRHGPQPHAIDPAGSYLVTGGLSGLGLLVAEWLADRGATSIVVMGRREPSPEARATLEGLEQRGTRITVVRGDVSVRADVEALFRRLADLPPLRGVMHAAGVLADGALLQQDWPRFWEPMAPKVAGTEHLQAALAGRPVDLFVMFSSVASVLGSAGQGNHAAANSFMDALAHERRRRGLPALDINWGVWSDVGAAVRSGADRRASEQGLGLIDPSAGLRMLDTLIRGDAIQATACPVDWARFGERYPAGRVPPLVSGLVAAPARPVQRKAAPAPAASAILRELDATPPAGRPRALLNHVRGQAQQVLGLPPSRAIDVRQPLNELGLDSLLAVELRNLISGALGRPLPATLLFDYPTIEALAGYLGREVLGLASAPDEAGPPPEAPAGVVERLEELSDEEVDRLLAERVARKPK